MDIEIPEVPVGILTLLSFFAPYAIALVNSPRWSTAKHKTVSIVVSAILGAVVWGIYYAMTGDGFTSWPAMILTAIVVTQASYSLVTKKSASRLEERTSKVEDI